MTPTTAQRAVLKIHMASDARPVTLLPCAPSWHQGEPEISEQAACLRPGDSLSSGRSLTAGGRQGLVRGRVLYGARHAGVFGDVDRQVACDVVQPGVGQRRRQGPHRAFGGLLGVVDEPVDPGPGEPAAGVTREGRLTRLRCLCPQQQWGAERGCRQPSKTGVSSF